jgi:hypothetical protein
MCDDLIPAIATADRQRLYQVVPSTARRQMARASFRRALAAGIRRHGPIPVSDFRYCMAEDDQISRPLYRYARQLLKELRSQAAAAA